MCGIAGLVFSHPQALSAEGARAREICERMVDRLGRRGPDERHVVRFERAYLGHTRLSIIDLDTGSQPIFNEDETIAVLANAEIYNFQELRADLIAKGHRFRSKGDIEVIVHLYEEYGERVFEHLNGMFAAVIYDSRRQLVLAGRDRAGEKPLAYSEREGSLLFASEIKSLLEHPEVPRDLDGNALGLFLNVHFVPAPVSIFKSIRKVPPSHYLRYDLEASPGNRLSVHRYWQPDTTPDWSLREADVLERTQQLLSDAVRMRMVSDVPIGVFLSGGIDSSAVTAYMAQHASSPVRTFTVYFGDQIDERPFARMVAERYGTDHTEICLDQNVLESFETAMPYYDEPFGDSSAIPTYLVSQAAREHVKTILTGDGGDELFAGYDGYIEQRYRFSNRYVSRASMLANRIALGVGVDLFSHLYARQAANGAYEHWYDKRSCYRSDEVGNVVSLDHQEPRGLLEEYRWLPPFSPDALSQAFSFDMNYYLPDDLLKKVDMASMRCSLECRAPFLDHRLIEFSLSVPPQLKVRRDRAKYVLKEALASVLPAEVLHREKQGFGSPVRAWLEGPLRDLTRDSLAPGCQMEAVVDRASIDRALGDFYGASQDWRAPGRLWLMLAYETWARTYLRVPV